MCLEREALPVFGMTRPWWGTQDLDQKKLIGYEKGRASRVT